MASISTIFDTLMTQCLLQNQKKELRDLLDKVEIESDKLGLQLNLKKTYGMVISKMI